MGPTPAGRRRILIVDDDQATRSGLAKLLERAGFETIAASTFQEGARFLREAAPDLLITDVRLGEFNGLHLVVMRPREMPAIVLTGFPDPVLEAEARRAGADYLLKPFSGAEIVRLAEQKLAAAGEHGVTSSKRRWERKHVSNALAACVEDLPARILDVSYGGLRFEIARLAERPVPSSFNVSLPPSEVVFPCDLVWTDRHDNSWLCGAQVSQENHDAALAWRGLVDALP
jgi:FixJ family two-component response regulator